MMVMGYSEFRPLAYYKVRDFLAEPPRFRRLYDVLGTVGYFNMVLTGAVIQKTRLPAFSHKGHHRGNTKDSCRQP